MLNNSRVTLQAAVGRAGSCSSLTKQVFWAGQLNQCVSPQSSLV